jgi:hypothetical protein
VPESNETRLTRLEERVKSNTDDLKDSVRILSPLVSQYAVLEEKFSGLRNDLNKGLDAIRAEITEIKEANKDATKWRRTMALGLAVAAIGLLGNFATQLIALRGGR